MRIFDNLLKKWNIIYSTGFVVSTGLLVDIWAGFATSTLFIISILIFMFPWGQKFAKYLDE